MSPVRAARMVDPACYGSHQAGRGTSSWQRPRLRTRTLPGAACHPERGHGSWALRVLLESACCLGGDWKVEAMAARRASRQRRAGGTRWRALDAAMAAYQADSVRYLLAAAACAP